MSNPPPGYPRVSPYLLYEDAPAAIDAPIADCPTPNERA